MSISEQELIILLTAWVQYICVFQLVTNTHTQHNRQTHTHTHNTHTHNTHTHTQHTHIPWSKHTHTHTWSKHTHTHTHIYTTQLFSAQKKLVCILSELSHYCQANSDWTYAYLADSLDTFVMSSLTRSSNKMAVWKFANVNVREHYTFRHCNLCCTPNRRQIFQSFSFLESCVCSIPSQTSHWCQCGSWLFACLTELLVTSDSKHHTRKDALCWYTTSNIEVGST